MRDRAPENFLLDVPEHGPRRATTPVPVGGVVIGGDAPIVVQSMANTDTADAVATAAQVYDLAQAGSELVRVTVNIEKSAAAIPEKYVSPPP